MLITGVLIQWTKTVDRPRFDRELPCRRSVIGGVNHHQHRMPNSLEIRWEFTPKALFEEQLTCDVLGCKISIDDGVVLATLPIENGQTCSPLRETVEGFVESLFLGVQFIVQAPCEIGPPRICTIGEEGSKGWILEAKTGNIRLVGSSLDLRYTRPDGSIVDTRRERIDRKHRFSRSAATNGTDDALARMLRSFRAALLDPRDELIHLYEVLDTLTTRFGSKDEALSRIGLPRKKWTRLGELCNHLPLRQGRHRGGITRPLRDATSDELEEARNLSAAFIESYVRFIESTK